MDPIHSLKGDFIKRSARTKRLLTKPEKNKNKEKIIIIKQDFVNNTFECLLLLVFSAS